MSSQFDKSQSKLECVVLAVKVHFPRLSLKHYWSTDVLSLVCLADRRPIDPPPIIQLRVLDPTASSPTRRPTGSSPDSTLTSPTSESSPTSRFFVSPAPYIKSQILFRHGAASTSPTDDQTVVKNSVSGPQYPPNFLQNPYYFMFASLAKPDDDAELHWLKVCPPPHFTCVFSWVFISTGRSHAMYHGFCRLLAIPFKGHGTS
jgi:hypothetical protein